MRRAYNSGHQVSLQCIDTHTKSASSLVPNSNSRKIKVKFDHPDPVKLFCCEVKEQQEASNKCQDQTDQQMLLLLPFKKPAVAVAKVMNTKKYDLLITTIGPLGITVTKFLASNNLIYLERLKS